MPGTIVYRPPSTVYRPPTHCLKIKYPILLYNYKKSLL